MDIVFDCLETGEAGADAIPVWSLTDEGYSAWLETAPDADTAWALANGFAPIKGEFICLPDEGGRIKSVLFGAGDGRFDGIEARGFGILPLRLPEGVYRIEGLESADAREQAMLGWILGAYRFTRYKTPRRLPARLVPSADIDEARVLRLARGMTLARDLINTPTEEMGPEHLEAAIRKAGAAYGASVEAITGAALLENNYPLIHWVGRAGAQEPRLVDLRWDGPAAAQTITLVGKGVCFDTGGLDIKPSAAMLIMKKDMGGAASILALATMIMDAKLPVKLRVLIPAVENSISSNSFRPGDVMTARNGITVENRNTDAEGRLVLADALVEAASEEPDLIVDMATLTGAARVALGADIPPFFTDDGDLAEAIHGAGEAMGDPVWRLPLYDGYERDISSSIADINNAPAGGMAGSITAALFLRRFVKNSQKWVHFDIYGWCQRARAGRPEGGECNAAMAMYKVIEDRCV